MNTNSDTGLVCRVADPLEAVRQRHRDHVRSSRVAMTFLCTLLVCVSVCAHAQVRLSFYGDTLKGDIKKMTEYTYVYSWEKYMRFDYSCDLTLCTETAVTNDTNHWRCAKWLVKFDDERVIEKSLYNSDGELCTKTTYTYNGLNRMTEKHFIDSFGGTCNSLTDYLDGGMSNWALGADQRSRTDDLYLYEYDTAGHIVKTEVKNFGSGGTDTMDDITEHKYDGKGNKVEADLLRSGKHEEKNRVSDGKEVTEKDFFIYDARNNLVENKGYFTATGAMISPKLHDGTMVGGGSLYTYDSLNHMTSVSYYRLYRLDDGSEIKDVYSTQEYPPIPMGEKGDEVQKEYDARGNVIKITRGAAVLLQREIVYF